jgi:hypothetical protein
VRNIITWFLVCGAVLCVVSVAYADGPPIRQNVGAPSGSRVFVPQLAADAAPTPLTCDAAKVSATDFEITYLDRASTAGLPGQVITGLVLNHCSATAQNLFIEAEATTSSDQLVGAVGTHVLTGLLAPGESSPFTFVIPAGSAAVTHLRFWIMPYTQPSGALARLHVMPGTVSKGSDGNTHISYAVTNDGASAAVFPRIAGRLSGPDCHDPFAVEMLNAANKIAPGARLTGELVVPGTCNGSAQLFAGSDAPVSAPLASGWSVRGAQAVYTADGALHLLALVCNNSDNHFLFPSFKIQFGGAAPTDLSADGTNYYPSGACRPLVSTFPNAPAGLQFDSLLAVDTGSGFVGVQAASGISIQPLTGDYPSYGGRPPEWGTPPPPPGNRRIPTGTLDTTPETDQDGFPITVWDPRWPATDPYGPYPLVGPGLTDPMGSPASADKLLDLQGADAPVPPAHVLSLLYNHGSVPLSSGDYNILGAGIGADGKVSAGLAIAAPPAIAAYGWAVVDTPLDSASIIAASAQPPDFPLWAATRPPWPQP